MRCQYLSLMFGLVATVLCSSLPDQAFYDFLSKRALTPDNTCGSVAGGNGNNYTCDPSLPNGGSCCSSSGYCGNSDAYCGTGCQSAFGTCNTTTTPSPFDPLQCGSTAGNQVCLNGLCCSSVGWCGNTTDYCGSGCQATFGTCSLAGEATPTSGGSSPTGGSPTGPTGSTTTCGTSNGNAVCATGLCCSPSGWCGTGEGYCEDPDCQYLYGTCDSDTTPAGSTTINDPRPLLGKVTYTDDIYDCVKPNVVALSYDDGPYNYTNELLDVLKSYNFTATFFITGNNLGKGAIDTTAPYPAIVQRMINEGHQVASHTWSHYNLSSLTSDMRKQQMVKNERAIANIIGKYPTYMRPPYSDCTQSTGCWDDLQSLGYHRTYFDLDTQDYLNPLPTQIQASKDIVASTLAAAAPGGDFLSIQHDIVQQSVANLSSYYYSLIQEKGWKGVTVGECLNDPKENWYRTPGGLSASSVASSATSKTAISTSVPTSTMVPTTIVKTSISTAINTPTTTAKTSSKTSTTTSAKSTAPTCVNSAGSFCGTIPAFTDKKGCQNAVTSCNTQSRACIQQAGVKNYQTCAAYAQTCRRLSDYCQTCRRSCSNAGFGK